MSDGAVPEGRRAELRTARTARDPNGARPELRYARRAQRRTARTARDPNDNRTVWDPRPSCYAAGFVIADQINGNVELV